MYDRVNYDILNDSVDKRTFQLAAAYREAFETISKLITSSYEQEKDKGQVRASEKTHKFCRKLADKMVQRKHEIEEEITKILSDARFSNWATDKRSKWSYKKTDQKAYWDRMVRDKVDTVFRYNAYVDKYKKQLRSDVNKLCRRSNWGAMSEADKANEFNQIFARIVRQAENDHPSTHPLVHKKVDEVFLGSSLTKSVVLSPPTKRAQISFWQKCKNALSSLWRSGRNAEEEVINVVRRSLKDALADVKQYDDETVAKCINLTNAALNKSRGAVSVEFKDEVFFEVNKVLQTELREIQFQWDKENSVSSRFESSRKEMKQYFELVGKGFHGAELLRVTMRNWLQQNLQPAFEEELAMLVLLDPKDKRWVSSGVVMQAFLDRDLVRLLIDRELQSVLSSIRNPREHMEQVISRLVHEGVQEKVKEYPIDFLRKVRTCLTNAAQGADTAARDRSSRFVKNLRDELFSALKENAATFLKSQLPDPQEAMFGCDDQLDIFTAGNADYVCTPMEELLTKAEKNVNYAAIDVCVCVVELFHKLSYGADNGVRPRCGEPCPICCCPCTRTRGPCCSSDPEDKRHDTHHQPIGLTGWRGSVSKELSSCTCSQDDWAFLHSDGKSYPISKFSEGIPDWSQPTKAFPLPLREYMFFNYQEELVASFTNAVKCSDIPRSYNRPLDVIREIIDYNIKGSQYQW